MVERGIQPSNFLTADTLKNMGGELVRLCDKVEQQGLVDYEIGVWEEEILSGESVYCALKRWEFIPTGFATDYRYIS